MRDCRALWGTAGPGRLSPSPGDKAPFSGLSAGPTQEKDAFLSGPRDLNGLFMASKRNTSGAVFHGRWKGPGLWAAGGLLAGNALCLGPSPPLPDAPYPTGRALSAVKGSLGSSSLGPAHPGAQLCGPGAHGGPGLFFCALKRSPPLPTCNLPLGAGAAGEEEELLEAWASCTLLLGQGRYGTLETIRRNFMFMQNTVSPSSVPRPLPSKKYFKEAPAAALPSGRT